MDIHPQGVGISGGGGAPASPSTGEVADDAPALAASETTEPGQAVLEAMAQQGGSARFALNASSAGGEGPQNLNPQAVLDSFGQLDMSFEANQGQTDAEVDFLGAGRAIRSS